MLGFVSELSADQTPLPIASRYYTDLAQQKARFFLTRSTDTTLPGVPEYAFPARAVELSDVFFDNRRLYRSTHSELEAFDIRWRDTVGSPLYWTVEDEDDNVFRLSPVPDRSATLTILHHEARVDFPRWIDLSCAFGVLSKDYARLSDHWSPEMVEVWSSLYQSTLDMLNA